MNEPISEMDKQLRDTPRVNLVIAIASNKGKRNACLFLCIIALAVILAFGWSNWLLLLPAVFGIGCFLYQMNILIVSSELKRRSEEPEEDPTPSEADDVDGAKKRLEFMKSHKEIITARLSQYLDEHPGVDDIPAEVTEQIVEECFLDHEIAELEAEIAQLKREPTAERSRDENERPLGTLTYDEASVYFTQYCELMQEKVGFREKESRLPTSLERMKEALKVECLNWCNHGKHFNESCEFIATGYMMLAHFLPDELVEQSSIDGMLDVASTGDRDAFEAAKEASRAASDLSERRMNELNAEWNEFQEEYRDKY